MLNKRASRKTCASNLRTADGNQSATTRAHVAVSLSDALRASYALATRGWRVGQACTTMRLRTELYCRQNPALL